jgi:polar amino acid transport system permease protein/cystine transport system permease protein
LDRFLERAPYFLAVILDGAVTTVEVTVGALILAIVVGLIVALVRIGGGPASKLAVAYIEFLRGTPVLAQLFILYFGLVEVGLVTLEPLQAAVLGLGLNGGAYLAEVFRAGIQAIHREQVEAALSVGLTPLNAMRRVILPQAFRIVLPPIGNFSIGLLKDTAVVSAVAAPEIMFRARQLTTETFQSGQIYLIAALVYLGLSLPLSQVVRRLERVSSRWR